ncbi:restriction endonuclease subunit S, partial [Methylophaga pinxianii]
MKLNERDNFMPKFWTMASLGEMATYLNGRAFKPNEWEKTGKPIVRIQNLNNANAAYNYSSSIHEERYLITNDELLYAWSASLGAYIWKGGEAWLNQHIFRVIPKPNVDKLFLYYLLTKITSELYAKSHGSGMVHITKGKFEETQVPLPPLNEQRRIVAKVEELFSELDNGIESLKKAREKLKVYRQAILKHAFEGKLTAKWREENKDKLVSPEQLLARIQQEREANYQQQLKNWKAAVEVWEQSGKEGKKPIKPKSITFPKVNVTPDMPIPKSWAVLELEYLALESVLGKMLDKQKNTG